MYLINKYTKWYYAIINNASTRYTSEYTEKHHIIPKSLGGTNDKSNLVVLTAREHYICHLLLIRMTSGQQRCKMVNAAYAMGMMNSPSHNRKNMTSSRVFATVRQQQANNMKIRVISPETRAKMSASAKLRKASPETRAKISLSGKGRTKSEEWKQKQSIAQKGKPKANHDEWLANVRAAAKLRAENLTEQQREQLRLAGAKGRLSRYGS